jgi:ATP-dependent Lon protease
VGAMPGKIIQCLKKTKTENPLVLIDEVCAHSPPWADMSPGVAVLLAVTTRASRPYS